MRKIMALLLTITMIFSLTCVAFAKENDKGYTIPEGAVVTFDGTTGITSIVTTTSVTILSSRREVTESQVVTTQDMSETIVGDPVARAVPETEYRTQGQGNGNGNYQFRIVTTYFADTTTTVRTWVDTTTTDITTTWNIPVTTTVTTVTTTQHRGNVNSNGKFLGTTVSESSNSVDGTPVMLSQSSVSHTVSGPVAEHSTTESVVTGTSATGWAPVK